MQIEIPEETERPMMGTFVWQSKDREQWMHSTKQTRKRLAWQVFMRVRRETRQGIRTGRAPSESNVIQLIQGSIIGVERSAPDFH